MKYDLPLPKASASVADNPQLPDPAPALRSPATGGGPVEAMLVYRSAAVAPRTEGFPRVLSAGRVERAAVPHLGHRLRRTVWSPATWLAGED